MTVKINTVSFIPDELMNAWLQHLRDFDAAHPGCHFRITAEAPDASLDAIVEALEIDPPLSHHQVIRRQ